MVHRSAVLLRHEHAAVDVVATTRTLSTGRLGLCLNGSSLGLVLVDVLFTLSEILHDLILSGNLTLEPGVAHDVSQGKPLLAHRLEHGGHEVLEIRGEEAFRVLLLVELPEQVGSVLADQLVVAVLRVRGREWWVTGIHDEEDHTKSEKVDHVTLIRLFYQLLRRHVRVGSTGRAQEASAGATLDRRRETKVSELQVKVAVYHHVFRFEVAVRVALGMNTVQHV